MCSDANEKNIAEQQQIRKFSRLLEIQRQLGSERNIQQMAGIVMHEVTELLDADRSSLFLFEPDTMQLRATYAEGTAENALVVPLRMGIVGVAILTRKILNIANAYEHPYFNPDIDTQAGYKTHCLLVTPILSKDGVALGGLEIINKSSGRFSQDDERAIEAAAKRLAQLSAEGQLDTAAAAAEVAELRQSTVCERGTVLMLDLSLIHI